MKVNIKTKANIKTSLSIPFFFIFLSFFISFLLRNSLYTLSEIKSFWISSLPFSQNISIASYKISILSASRTILQKSFSSLFKSSAILYLLWFCTDFNIISSYFDSLIKFLIKLFCFNISVPKSPWSMLSKSLYVW